MRCWSSGLSARNSSHVIWSTCLLLDCACAGPIAIRPLSTTPTVTEPRIHSLRMIPSRVCKLLLLLRSQRDLAGSPLGRSPVRGSALAKFFILSPPLCLLEALSFYLLSEDVSTP